MVKGKAHEKESGQKDRHGRRSSDRNKIVLGTVTAVFVIVSLGAYLFSVMSAGIVQSGEIMMGFIAVVIVVTALLVTREKFKSYKAGLPAEDEMSKKCMQKAGYYAWLVSIYALLGSRMLGEDVAEASGDWSLVGTYMMLGGIVVPALFFFAAYFWFSRKGGV